MTDDVVMRLRVATVADSTDSLYKLMTDAADEIERLRRTIKVLEYTLEASEGTRND